MNKRLTAVICTWPAGDPAYLEETIESFRDQGIEPVVVNDDRPIDVKWNEALDTCKTEYLCLPHADDVYGPRYAKEMIAHLDAHPEAAAAFCMDRFIDKDGLRRLDHMGNSATKLPIPAQEYYRFPEVFNGMLKNGNFLRCETVVFRMSMMDGLRYAPKLECGTAHDVQMWWDILNKYPIAILDKQLVSYRIHDKQDTQTQRTDGPVDHWDAMRYGMNLRPDDVEWDVRIALSKTIKENDAKKEESYVRERMGKATSVEFHVIHELPDNAGTGILCAHRVREFNKTDGTGIAYFVVPHPKGTSPGPEFVNGVPVLFCHPNGFGDLVDLYRPKKIEYWHLLRWPLEILGVETDAEKIVYLHDSYLWCERWHSINKQNEVCNEPEPHKCEECSGIPEAQIIEKKKTLSRLLPNIPLIRANSPYTASNFEKAYGIRAEIEEPIPPPLPTHQKLTRIGYFGSAAPVKGFHILMQAWRKIKGGQLLLFCDVPDEFKDGRGIHGYDSVLVMGAYRRADLPRLLNLCDLVVVPSINESYGLVKREVEMCGVHCIATGTGGLAGTIEPNNPEALAKAIQEAIDA